MTTEAPAASRRSVAWNSSSMLARPRRRDQPRSLQPSVSKSTSLKPSLLRKGRPRYRAIWRPSEVLPAPGGPETTTSSGRPTAARVDAVSAASVLPTHRRRGLLSRMLTTDLHAARERGEVASILLPAEYPIYGRFGFGPAVDRADYALDTAAAEFTRAAPGTVELVEPARLRELAPPIFDRFRRQRP